MLKYDELPLNNNDIFLSCSSGEIKWKDLDQELDEKIEILKEHRIGPHVIFIIAEEVKSIDDFYGRMTTCKSCHSDACLRGRFKYQKKYNHYLM